MSSETELRKWLHRVEKSHLENITFAMRVWNSMEFNLLTKHEIITEECCKIVSKLSEEVKTAEDIDSMWNVVNEFLGMKCSSGAVANSVKIALCKTVVDVVKSMNCQRCIVYKALVTMLQNTAMQGFFKSNAKYFGMVAGLSIDYLKKLLEKESDLNRSDLDVVKVVQITKNFIKQTPFLNDFRKPFVKYLLVPLSELFIDLRKDKIVDESDFFNILHEIYFADNDNENPMNHMLLHPENEEFTYLLNVPIHAFMLIVEGVFQSVKVATTIQAAFIKYLFDTYFNQSNEKFANENEMLMSLSMFLSLLKRYDVPLSLKIDGINATEFIGKKIECLNITQSNLYEILLVLCASIELNPMMLEQSTMSLVVKCMLHRKDDRTVVAFERFLILIIDMYRRLSRSEKFISNLTRTMWQKLSDFKLSKKIKRKIGAIDCNSSMNDSPKRLRIDSDGNVSTPVALNENNELNRSQLFLELLNESICSNETKPLSSLGSESNTHWRNIQFAWPNRVGEEFSKYISGLVSKPSLVVWKTLIFTMTDYIKLIKNGDLSENSLFLIDWTSALLCQYFHGCRLAEQSDKTWELIEENRKLQRNLLKDFGSAILSQEHNIRTMNAFLSLCHASGNFDLLSWFYCPDSITPDQIERSIGCHSNDFVHSYLQPTEWVLIEQRISNFGKHECRSNLNRLYLQKVKSKLMLKSSNGTVDVADPLLSSILADHGLNELNDILLDETANQWFIEQLTRSQKIHVARSVVELDCDVTRSSNLVRALARRVENQEFLDFLAVALFERIGVHASGQTIKRIDFMEVFAGNESICKDVVRQLKNVSACEVHLEKPSELQIAFELLDDIPLGFVSATFKNILFHLTLGLLLQHTNQITIRSCCRYLKKFLLHGDSPDVFRFLKIKQLPRIFDHFGTDANVMYKFFFEKKLIELDPSTSKVLDELLQLIQNEANENSICCSYLDVGIHLLNLLNKIKCKEFSAQYRDVILTKIREFFDEKNARSQVDEEAFVSKTVSGFVNIVSNINEFDETLKRIVGIYFKHMKTGYDSHSVKLLNVIFTNKTTFGYTDSDISKIIEKFWNSLITDLNSAEDPGVFQFFIKFVVSFKSCEELMDMFIGLNLINIAETNVIEKCKTFEKLFRLVFKCEMNKTKGNMFSEFFRQVAFQFIIKIRMFDMQTQHNIRHQLLDCQRLLCTNIKIPISFELIDDIISFMSDTLKYEQINKVSDATILKETHARLSDLCHSLILHRHYFIIDRIPQIVVILKELLQLICWYKCDRGRDKQLDDEEVTILTELSHKLENTTKALVKHTKDVKRVAPYLLLSVMNFMISKENVSTMYSKIKMHFDYICYDLISACDHRVKSFIMRNCNEASKQQYETLMKEYNKYHKFKGKV